MHSVSQELHDRCIAARSILKARNPELFALVTARGVVSTAGSQGHKLMKKLRDLDRVASSFATGDPVRPALMQRVARILADLET